LSSFLEFKFLLSCHNVQIFIRESEGKYEVNEYNAKQCALCDLGVMTLLARTVCSLDDFSFGGIPDLALDLFIEILNGNNF